MRHIAFAVAVIGLSLIALAVTQLGTSEGGSAVPVAQTPTPSPPATPVGNHAPISQDAEANAISGITLENISLEAHDADYCAGHWYSISIVTLPEHGELANQDWPGSCQDQAANGYALLVTTFDYTSEGGFVGTDTITFAYTDGYGYPTGNVATFTVHVQAGEPPTPTPVPIPSCTPPGGPPSTGEPGPTIDPTPTPVCTTPTPTSDATPTDPPTTGGATPTPVGTSTPALPTPTPTATPSGQTPAPTSGEPTPTPTPTPGGQTPIPTPTSPPVPLGPIVGNWDCDSDVSSVDALKELRYVASLPVSQNEPCPDMGAEMSSMWGDVDCNGDITSIDALKILRHVAGVSVSQTEPCADIGGPLY